MKRISLAVLCALILSPALMASQIVLVYPRAEGAARTHVYAATLDSTFVLGRVEPPSGELSVNGAPVSFDSRGAFLAWLPLRKAAGQRSWDFVLNQKGQRAATLSFPYAVVSDTTVPVSAAATENITFPRVLRVTANNAHTRSAPDGTYHVFPDSGCRVLAVGQTDGYYRVKLCEGLEELLESSSATLDTSSRLIPLLLRNGVCSRSGSASIIAIGASRPVPWISTLSPDRRSLRVTLFGALAGSNRIRYDVRDEFLSGVEWEQLPGRLQLDIRCAQDITRGYTVSFANDSLRIHIRAPYFPEDRRLRGKVIVLDPGHGGASSGTIGPLGTEEKDVVLKWAEMVGKELRRKGAVVYFTRETDTDVALYDRTRLAERLHPDLFLSLHCNALPDSQNPLLRHGTGTYYYQSQSRDAAVALHTQLLTDGKLADDGLYDANLAVVRPTDFPAVLIEAAYLIYPPEEQLLRSDVFLRALAQGVARGLNDYFQRVP
ncbi:MAG TPA: N-acetylmuramoyl-L-alanine amidase [bacterium]|jgi:N-acetylmuramoyl-L-alanine amidase